MKTSFSTLGCPDWSLEQIVKNARECKYNGVELRTHNDGNHFNPNAPADEARRVGEMFRSQGVPVISILGYTHYAYTKREEVEKNQALTRTLIAHAEAMGAPYVRVFAGRIPVDSNFKAMLKTVGNALKPLALEAADHGVTLALETHDDWCAGKAVMALMDIVGTEGFGLVYDIFNSFHAGTETWDQTYAQVKDHICYCHLKDGYQGLDGNNKYVMVGAGDLPIAEILARFKADGFDGYFSFEWEKKWHPELEPPERVFPHYPHKVRAMWDALPGRATKTKPKAAAKQATRKKNGK